MPRVLDLTDDKFGEGLAKLVDGSEGDWIHFRTGAIPCIRDMVIRTLCFMCFRSVDRFPSLFHHDPKTGYYRFQISDKLKKLVDAIKAEKVRIEEKRNPSLSKLGQPGFPTTVSGISKH